jgi:hypothetical protein
VAFVPSAGRRLHAEPRGEGGERVGAATLLAREHPHGLPDLNDNKDELIRSRLVGARAAADVGDDGLELSEDGSAKPGRYRSGVGAGATRQRGAAFSLFSLFGSSRLPAPRPGSGPPPRRGQHPPRQHLMIFAESPLQQNQIALKL